MRIFGAAVHHRPQPRLCWWQAVAGAAVKARQFHLCRLLTMAAFQFPSGAAHVELEKHGDSGSLAIAHYAYDLQMIYEDTLRFAGYGIGACFLEIALTQQVSLKEKATMVLAGALGSAAYHLLLKKRWSKLNQYPSKPISQRSAFSQQHTERRALVPSQWR
jgi:hypothetical protein